MMPSNCNPIKQVTRAMRQSASLNIAGKPLVLLVLFLFTLCAGAQSEAPSMTVELSKDKAYLGDPVTYTVNFGSAEGWRVLEEPLEEKVGEAAVLEQSWDRVKAEETSPETQRFQANIAFYKLGEQEVPQQTFRAEGPDGSVTELVAPALPITIEPLLQEQDQAMADNKGQVALDVPFFWLLLIVGLLAIVLLVLLVLYFRARRGEPKKAPPKPAKPPYEEALDRLAQLTGGSLLKEGRIKDFYVAINLIVRHYFHRLFGIQAEEMTTFEFEDWMRDEPGIPEETKALCREFQELCDRVKFAKYDPVETETKDLVNHAYQIVEQLRPKPEEVRGVQAG